MKGNLEQRVAVLEQELVAVRQQLQPAVQNPNSMKKGMKDGRKINIHPMTTIYSTCISCSVLGKSWEKARELKTNSLRERIHHQIIALIEEDARDPECQCIF